MDPYGDHNRKIRSPLDLVKEKVEAEILEDVKAEEMITPITDKVEAKLATGLEEEEEEEEDKSTLVDHLTDLRKEIIKSTIVFLLAFTGVFSTINLWFPYVTRGHELIVLGPLEVVKFYMSISFALALGLSMPIICHFLWKFVKPGLNDRESRFLGLYSPVMFLLFIIGIAFGFYVVNPLSYSFLISIGAMNFTVMVSAQEYARFLLMTTVPLGLLFELPIIALFLSTIGLLTADKMKEVRKWSYLSIAVISALITPPDFISQLIVLIPMGLLYEASIYIVLFSERRNAVTN